MPEPFQNTLYYGDNLDVLQRYVKDESVDLVYLDPPFNSNQDYNILFDEKDGSQSAAQIKAFEDTWQWDIISASSFHDVIARGGRLAETMIAFEKILGRNDMLAYLSMMAPRIGDMHRVLKPTGSIYLHCDPTASHYLKLLMDAIFEPENFRNEIIWRRTGNNKSAKRFGPLHQTILFYAKSDASYFDPKYGPYTKEYVEKFFTKTDERGYYQSVILTGPGVRHGDSGQSWRGYNPTSVGRHWQPASYLYSKYRELTGEDLAQYPLLERFDKLDEIGLIHWGGEGSVPRYKFYILDAPGVPYQDIWAYQPGTTGSIYGRPDIGIDEDVKWLTTRDRERSGYPTQKPEGLLERIIESSCPDNGVVLDPFCGCGTTVAVAQRLGRRWIGIDVTHLAISLMKHRLKVLFSDNVSYKVVGEPISLPDVADLAKTDPYQFQWWALGQVGARPIDQKKGADKGIDGRLYFYPDGAMKGKIEQIIFSVKAGHVTVSQLRDLVGVVGREKAAIGVLITLEAPTKPMRVEAASAGFYQSSELDAKKYPKIQILTIEDLFSGKKIDCPPFALEGGNITLGRGNGLTTVKRKDGSGKLSQFD